VFAIGEPNLVHRCPMHDTAGAHDAHGEHAAHGQHGSQPAPHSHQCCSCIGACTTAAGAVVPTVALVPTAIVSLADPAAPATQVQFARFEAQRVLPYANGPPA
jgi:hypothetical protein